MMESMYKFAKYHYDCGNYAGTTSYLYFYLLVMSPTDKVSDKLYYLYIYYLYFVYYLELLECSLGKIGI